MDRAYTRLKDIASWLARRLVLASLLTILILILRSDGPAPGRFETQIRRRLVGYRFDFLSWELKALSNKLWHSLASPQHYMNEEARSAFLLDYLDLTADVERLLWEIDQIYTDPDVTDPATATREMRRRLFALRQDQANRQLLGEAILEEQVAIVLMDEGFDVLGAEFPPALSHFTPLPTLLVVSPRERIERIYSSTLNHGLIAAQREEIEQDIYHSFDKSALITNIGGLSAYPAMLLESSSLNWVMEVTAHEWAHHYLSLHPLGWNYDATEETRTINETVASIVGQEVGRAVVARYYPHLLPPEPEPWEEALDERVEEDADRADQPLEFDFHAAMRETRIQVDELLAEGKIDAAESYMEERRQAFVEHGYLIRKLNQAYFAFHGAYADRPGASGLDPTGPAVRRLRDRIPDLYTFVSQVASVTSLAEIQELLQRLPE